MDELGAKDIHAIAGAVRSLDSPRALHFAYCINNEVSRADFLAALPALAATQQCGFTTWPKRIATLVRGRSILDVGCGNTLYGVALRALGASSYRGTDARLDLDRRDFKSPVTKSRVATRLSLRDVMRTVPSVKFERREDIPNDELFDLVTLHTVTEHLQDIDQIFGQIAKSLAPGGRVWFLHDNYFSWGGHHLAPRSPSRFVADDPEQRLLADWGHVNFDPPPGHYIGSELNRIRLDDLRALVERHFSIVQWVETPESPGVIRRLTPQVKAKLPNHSTRELLTKHVVCLAERRDGPAGDGEHGR